MHADTIRRLCCDGWLVPSAEPGRYALTDQARRWLAGRTPIPAGIGAECLALLRARRHTLAAAEAAISAST